MEHQILQRDPAVYAGVDAQLDQHFLTPGQRLSPPGVGNVMLLLICLTLGMAGTMGLLADLAFAATGRASAATLLGSGAVMAVWMTLILFQLVQGKNVGVLLLKYYLGMLTVFLIGAVAAWIANITGMANGLMLLCACIGGVIFSNRTVFYLYVAYFRTRRRVFVKRRWQMEAMRNP
ncbi:MAG: hypothetical protein ACTH5V_14260 [Serratia proteamaculans]|nr:hypothetical protein [Serratia proteamaculans]MDW5513361.1 hypothetical protein [Serratia proteamaculans]